MVSQSESEILSGCKKGEKDSFKLLFKKHSPWMMGICLRYCQNRNDAKDVMQETLIKIFNGIEKFNYQTDAQFVAWLKRITVNTSLNFIREQSKNGFIMLEDHHSTLIINEEINDYNESENIPQERLLEMINEMPSGYRAVFNMYVFDQMSHKEIAQELGISENTSKTQLMKARVFLKNMISKTVKSFTI